MIRNFQFTLFHACMLLVCLSFVLGIASALTREQPQMLTGNGFSNNGVETFGPYTFISANTPLIVIGIHESDSFKASVAYVVVVDRNLGAAVPEYSFDTTYGVSTYTQMDFGGGENPFELTYIFDNFGESEFEEQFLAWFTPREFETFDMSNGRVFVISIGGDGPELKQLDFPLTNLVDIASEQDSSRAIDIAFSWWESVGSKNSSE